MGASQFQNTTFGRPARKAGDPWAFTYYHPAALPRDLDLRNHTILALSEADAALGLLDGLGRLIQDPQVLLGPFLTREALASSRIEGTNASLSDVLKAQGNDHAARSDDVAEVERYLSATHLGLRLIETLPITQRLILETHQELMRGVRGAEKMPGQLRTSPVWVGAAGATPDTARFVPPLPEQLPELLSDWERFVNEPPRLPTLVRSALMHYQFETIHPLLDGNGRIGRLLIGLQLVSERRLSRPLLYLSGYLEAHRTEYYDRLQAVRETGAIQEWLQFFLVAIRRQAEDAAARAGALVELRERYYQASRLDRSHVAALIPLMFSNPFLSVSSVQRTIKLTAQGVRNLFERAANYKWLEPVGPVGRSGMYYWLATEVFDIIDRPLKYGAPIH
jgi:cell filamentation protein, protein adenylyltransferase